MSVLVQLIVLLKIEPQDEKIMSRSQLYQTGKSLRFWNLYLE